MTHELPSRVWICSLLLPFLFSAMTWGQPAIQTVSGAKPKTTAFRPRGWQAPLVIRNREDAARHFADDNLAKVIKHVDFEQQIVLLFAWRGSGQDRLNFSVTESEPAGVKFSYRPGRTRDLRPHAYVFVLPSDTKWSVK